MTWFRHRVGFLLALLAMGLARLTHAVIHVGIWLRDEDDEYECEGCNEDNEPTDGPWAI